MAVMNSVSYETIADLLKDIEKVSPSHGDGWGYGLDSHEVAVEKCIHGEDRAELTSTLDLVDATVAAVERDMPQTHFRTEYGVEGCDVDVDRFLAGEPESMISYPLIDTPRTTKVVTLCASVAYSGSVHNETIQRRGEVVVAFVVACLRMGISVECWADWSQTCTMKRHDPEHQFRACVKRADEPVDEARLMFTFTNPAMYRRLGEAQWRAVHTHKTWGEHCPADPPKTLPEGTIYMPSLLSAYGAPNAEEALRSLLKEAGIIE